MQSAHVYGCCRRAFFCCKLSDQRSQLDAQAVAISLAVFAAVYFVVFGAGVFYILKFMGKTPHDDESGLVKGVPTRAAGGIAVHANQHGQQPAQ